MRILHITDRDYGVAGGRESHIRRFSDSSDAMGHINTSATPGEALEFSNIDSAANPRVTPDVVLLHSAQAWTSANEIRERFPQSKILAWVHDQSFVCPASISWFRRTRTECWLPLGAHCVVNAYTRHCNSRRPDRNLGNCRRVRSSLDSIDALDGIIVASRYMAKRLEAGRVPEEMLHVHPYFVNRDSQSTGGQTQTSPTRNVLYVGRLNETKGVDVLINAMGHLPDTYRLKVVGDGYVLKDLKTLARQIDESGVRITFTGQIDGEERIREAYTDCDVLAVPSLWPEPFGIVGLEAMAHGRPVVASRVGGIPEWLIDAHTGYLTEPDNALDLAAKLHKLLDDNELRAALGARALAHVRETYSWDAHWTGFLNIIDGIKTRQQFRSS